MSETLVNKKYIFSKSEEDRNSIFLGKIRTEDLQGEDLIEPTCDDLRKQSFLDKQETEVNTEATLDELLDLVDITEDKRFSKKFSISEILWQKVLGLLNLFNEVFALELDEELASEIAVIKEKQKKKNLLSSFLDAIRKKFFKKELSLEEMLDLQIKRLEEQLQIEVDPEMIGQIKKQLESLIQLKARLFELSLEQNLVKTLKWLFTVSAIQAVGDIARGEERRTKDVVTTNEQWGKINFSLKSGEFGKQVEAISKNLENQNIKNILVFRNENNNLPYPQQNAFRSDTFLSLLYLLLLHVTIQGIKHMGAYKEVTVNLKHLNSNVETQVLPIQKGVKDRFNSNIADFNSSDPKTLDDPDVQPVMPGEVNRGK